MGHLDVRERAPEIRVRPRSRISPSGAVGIGLALLVALVWFVTVWRTGSPFWDLTKWCLAVVCAILAPGFVLVRSSRRAVAPLIEDLTWAVPAGSLVALTGWFLDRVLPFSPGAFVVGPLVVLAGLAVPATRRRILARPAPGWGIGPVAVLAGVQLFAITWMVVTGLKGYSSDPGLHGTAYYPDVLYQLDLVGELRHHLVPTYPPVAGTSLSYHWFFYAITAHLDTGSNVIPFDSTVRLGPATMVPAIIMLMAVVARRIAGRVWAGPIAAVLFGALGISVATRWSVEDGSTGIVTRVWRSSPPQTMGWVAAIALTGVLIAFLRRGVQDRAVPVALLVPFFVLAAGSKSSEIPVLLAGVGLAALVALLRRDWPQFKRCVAGLAIGGLVFEAAALTIYGGNSYGVRLYPFGHGMFLVFKMFPGKNTHTSSLHEFGVHYPLAAFVAAIPFFVLPLLPRLLGLLFQLRYRVGDPAGWVTLGATVAGFTLLFITRHPAGSEIYFMQSAYPIGVLGAASGITLALARVRDRLPGPVRWRRYLGLLAGVFVTGAVAATVVAVNQPHLDPVSRWIAAHPGATNVKQAHLVTIAWQWWKPMFTLLAVLAVVAVVVGLVARRVWRRPATNGEVRGRAPVAWLAALSLVLGTGALAAALQYGGTLVPPDGAASTVHPPAAHLRAAGLLPLTRQAFAAGAYVDEHAGANDVVATNMYCRFSRHAQRTRNAPCDARNFAASALTQRRSLVGGWAYSDRVVASAWSLKVAYRNAPFWDHQLAVEQYDSFAHPTQAVLDDLYLHHHVRWMFLDLRDGQVDTSALDRLAIRRMSGPTIALYQLRVPAATGG